MNDEIARLQIPEVGEKRPGRRSTPLVYAPFFLEEICFCKEPEFPAWQMKSARQLPGRDKNGRAREIVGFCDRAGANLVVGQQFDGALRSARRGGNKHDRLAVF